MSVFKTPDFCNGVKLCIVSHLNKKLIYGITVNANVFGDVVVSE